jgi:quercetin dioxygenase-like cupin family protein
LLSRKVIGEFRALGFHCRGGIVALLTKWTTALLPLAMLIGAAGYAQKAGPAQSERVAQFENEEVKVWRSVIAPGTPLTLHRHDHPRVIIALRGGKIRIAEAGGAAQTEVWEAGRAYWLPSNAPNTRHADVNLGQQAIEVMVVELKHEK